jgi:hypothetical protein
MALGRVGGGIVKFGGAMQLDPSLVAARVNLGGALANRGRVAEVMAQFETILRLDLNHAGGQDCGARN